MDPSAVRNMLLAQHEQIRQDVSVCRRLSERHRAGELVTPELDLALSRLRSSFDEHNRTETSLLLPLLLDASQGRGTRGTQLAERMLEEHAAEHHEFWHWIEAPLDDLVVRIEELFEQLDAHMAAEERTFLSPVLLRTDQIRHPPTDLC